MNVRISREARAAVPWLPVGGVAALVGLYFYAASLYPGGSQVDHQTRGYSQLSNYWCELLNPVSYSGAVNPGRPFAVLVASRFILGLPAGLLMRERFDSFAKAARVTVPALLLHGTRDGVVPYAMGAKLAQALPRARLITLADGHHNDLFLGEGWRLFDEVASFVRDPRAAGQR